jgi:hypothetical protein
MKLTFLLLKEWTVIDETQDLFRAVFPLPMIDPADLTRLSSARVVTVGRDYFSARAKLPLKTVV